MRVLVTGAEGFLGRNLCVRLAEIGGHEVLPVGRGASEETLRTAAAAAHLGLPEGLPVAQGGAGAWVDDCCRCAS